MENRLKKQLALIKARAITVARRGTSLSDPNEESSSRESVDTVTPYSSSREPRAASANPIVNDLIRVGAVARASELENDRMAISRRHRRGPWWWRRRLGRSSGGVDPIARSERESGYEAEFQRVLKCWRPVIRSRSACGSGEPRSLDGTSYYLVRSTGSDIDPVATVEAERFASLDSWPTTVSRSMVGRFVRRGYAAHGYGSVSDLGGAIPLFQKTDPRSILFLDIETAGLSANTYVFLCGLMHFVPESGTFHAEQVFARDYAEEEGLLLHVRAALERFDTVVTYNGASFTTCRSYARAWPCTVFPTSSPWARSTCCTPPSGYFARCCPTCAWSRSKSTCAASRASTISPAASSRAPYHEYVRTQDAAASCATSSITAAWTSSPWP
jgi:hypothetical protein